MIMSFVGVDLGDSESQEGKREELKGVFEGSTVGNFGEEGVVLSGFGVGFGLQSSKGTLNCVNLLEHCGQ
jgi:hypothetical protein